VTDKHEPDQDALLAEIEQTRTELGETVEALAARTHVTARVKDAAGRATGQIKDAGEAAVDDVKAAAARGRRFAPFAAVAAAVTAVAGWRIWRRGQS
jgi:phage gp45-like